MAEFKPYSVTRGGFATPRELYMSVVKDLTQYYSDGNNAFEITYPTDISDLDFTNLDSPANDVVIVQATNLVDPCVNDTVAKQPWVIRFDTRTSIGHGMGHINVTTPLQIDWTKPKAPAIPYIPPNVPYDADSIYTEGTLGFVGMRVPDGDGSMAASNERGFINRAVYHTKVTQVQKSDEFGNLLWDLTPHDGSAPVRVHGTRRIEPEAGLDEMGRVTYRTGIEWYELMNPDEIDLSAKWPAEGEAEYRVNDTPTPDLWESTPGMARPNYQKRKCWLSFKAYPGLTAVELTGNVFTTFKVEGELPQSMSLLADADTTLNSDNVPQKLTFMFEGDYPELTGYKVKPHDSVASQWAANWTATWVEDPTTSAKWSFEERAVTDFEDLNAEENQGVVVYDNNRYQLIPVADNAFDTVGAARDPREGALNVPMSYALTVSDHGVVVAVWDQAVDQYETNQGHRFSWFVAQRLVDKDTGKALVDQNKSFCPLYCVYGVYHEKLATSMYFVARESDVHRPSEEQLAGEDSPDSNAVLNTFEQVAVSEDYEYVITVPSGLTTQRYLYLEEADLIGYTSADVISNGALSEFQMYDEGVCSVTGVETEAECVAQGGDWTASTRLYKGLPSTGKYNTGMRVLMRWHGGRLGSEQP